jgi:hypothetical protein
MTRMNSRKIVPIRQADPFTKEARTRWDEIPKEAQAQILENAFCVKCRDAVSIILESAKMQRDDLILRGKCKICGHEVGRLVEPDNK